MEAVPYLLAALAKFDELREFALRRQDTTFEEWNRREIAFFKAHLAQCYLNAEKPHLAETAATESLQGHSRLLQAHPGDINYASRLKWSEDLFSKCRNALEKSGN